MAPSPDNNSAYANPLSDDSMPHWKGDQASKGLYEEANLDGPTATASASKIATENFDPTLTRSPSCYCFGFPSKVASSLKQSWVNPKYFRWVVTVVVSVFYAICIGFFNSFGPLYLCFRRDLHSTAVETGSVASVGWSLAIMSPIMNVLYQRVGPRKIYIIGSILCFAGLLSTSFAHSIWPIFVTFGLIFGVGVNLILTGSMNLVASYFASNECALPTALPGIGGSIGMLIYSPVVEIAYDRFGWRASLRFVAVLILAAGLVCAVWQKRPASQKRRTLQVHSPPPVTSATLDVASNGYSTARNDKEIEANYEDDAEATIVTLSGKEAICPKQEKLLLLKERRQKTKENYKYLSKDVIHWMFCLATMLSNIVLVFNIINLIELMTSSGYSAQKSAMFMSILSFSETGFRVLTGVFGDRLPCARILLLPVVSVLCACTTFSLTFSTSAALIVTYVCFAGMGRAVNYSIIYSASIEIFGHEFLQESFSFVLVAYGIACFPAAIIPGLSFDLTGSYQSANYCGSILWLISAALYLAVYFLKNRRNRLTYECVLSSETPSDALTATPVSGKDVVATSVCDTFTTLPMVALPDHVIVDKISTV